MDLYEQNTCSFVVKVWVEPNGDLMDHLRWRGHITQVFTGQRQYFENMAALVNFILLHLAQMGANLEQTDQRAPDASVSHSSGVR